MKRSFVVIIVFLCLILFKSYGQNDNIVKISSDINTVFKGEGFSFNSIGYERFLNNKNSIGFWFGGDLKTSKLEFGNDITTSSLVNCTFAFDYSHFLYKHNNNGIFISPSIFYKNTFSNIDDNRQNGYGLSANIGYRHTFNKVTIDCVLFSTFEYLKQKNNVYTYRSKEIKPIDIKISIGYGF